MQRKTKISPLHSITRIKLVSGFEPRKILVIGREPSHLWIRKKKNRYVIASKSFKTKKSHHKKNAPKEHSLIDHLDLFSHCL